MKKISNFKKVEIDARKISGGHPNDTCFQGNKDCVICTDCPGGGTGSDISWGDCCGIDTGGNPFDFERINYKENFDKFVEPDRFQEGTYLLNFNF